MSEVSKKVKKQKNQNSIAFKDSIKTRLILTMIILTALPLIVSLTVSYQNSTRKDIADSNEMLLWQAEFIQAEFSSIIDKNMSAIKSFAASQTVIHYLHDMQEKGTSEESEDVLHHLKAIDNMMADTDRGNLTAIANASGMQLMRSDGGDCIDMSDRTYYLEVMKGSEYVSDIIVSKSTGKRILILVAPIFDNDGKSIIGVAQRNFDLNAIHEFLAENADDAFIVDRAGKVAAHSQYEITIDNEEDRSQSVFMTSGLTRGNYSLQPKGKDYHAMMGYIKEPATNFTIVVAVKSNEVLASARQSAMIIVIIGLIMLIIAIFISFYMARLFTAPIFDINNSIARLADGYFVAIRKNLERKDEFGQMITNTNSVIEKLESVISTIKTSATEVASSSDALSSTTDQISQTTSDVSNAVQEISGGAMQQAEEIQRISENVSKIDAAVSEVQQSSDKLADIAGKMKEASSASSQSLTNLQKSSSNMTTRIDEISATISATRDAVSNINERVESITSIATQTNLLSLNASIEAARAGEFGKGFAVVAEEIGKLANDSKQMADDIRHEMDILLEKSGAAVDASDEVRKTNLEQQEALGEALTSVNGMLTDIDDTVSGVNTIKTETDTCVEAKNVVSDAMTSLSAISQENAAAAAQTGSSMEQLSDTVSILAGSAGSLNDIAEQLSSDMEFFKDE